MREVTPTEDISIGLYGSSGSSRTEDKTVFKALRSRYPYEGKCWGCESSFRRYKTNYAWLIKEVVQASFRHVVFCWSCWLCMAFFLRLLARKQGYLDLSGLCALCGCVLKLQATWLQRYCAKSSVLDYARVAASISMLIA